MASLKKNNNNEKLQKIPIFQIVYSTIKLWFNEVRQTLSQGNYNRLRIFHFHVNSFEVKLHGQS